jgi:tetratricopeptide (TPR) repeat protein
MRASLFFPIVLSLLGLSLLACKPNKENPASPKVVATGDPVLDQLSQAIADNPTALSLHYERAARYYELQNYDEAITDLQQALRFDSANVECLHLLADVYLDYFRSREAIRTMEKTISFYPERIPSLLKLCEFQLILKQHEASLKTIDRVLQLDPQNAEGYFMMGMNFKESGDTARAINAFQTAVENDPELLDAWINLGQLQAALGNKIAARYFDSALRVAPNSATALHAKAYYLQEQGKLSEALALFRKMGSLDPQNAEAHYNAGLLCLDLDSIPQAWRAFDLAIRMDPVHVRAYFYRGLASEMQGNARQARTDYQQALKLSPDYEKARQGLERLETNPK